MSQEALLIQEPSYRLAQLDMYNWGGFCGKHHADINPEGTAVIGPTGSGKTTLVDALMTLITAHPKYNLASTGGHESDRDLASYVRGVTGPGDGSESQSHVARPAKTVTGISATLSNDENIAIIGAVLWFDDSSTSPSDMKKFWYVATSTEHSLDVMLDVHQQGGMRALKQRTKVETGLWSFTSKTSFLARIRDFFEVRDNAFNLLNRAAGLKQLNSIDEIFRELVLDDTSQFERAKEVANSFDDLADIHQELVIARKQQASLEPVKATWEQCVSNRQQLTELEILDENLPTWFARQAYALWKTECERLVSSHAICKAQLADSNAAVAQKKNSKEQLNQAYLQLGGADIETLKTLINDKQKRLATVQNAEKQFGVVLAQVSSPMPGNRVEFEQSQKQISAKVDELTEQKELQQEQAYSIGSELFGTTKQLDECATELQEIENSPSSNIPMQFQRFRKELAEYLEVEESAIPFLAELVQVKQDYTEWRGAIERAMGSQKLRILVPPEQMDAALRWVNHRDNRLHVRLWEVKQPAQTVTFFEDGYLRKLDYKDHPYREAAKYLLSTFDLHCVKTTEDLRNTAHALTVQGMMSAKRGFFDKQDQRSIQDNWFTGFDNKDRLTMLQARLDVLKTQQRELAGKQSKAKKQADELSQTIQLLSQAQKIDYAEIDVASVEAELANEQEKLKRLTQPETDMAKAKAALEECEQALRVLETKHLKLVQQEAGIRKDIETAQSKRSEFFALQEKDLTDEAVGILENRFKNQKRLTVETITESERKATAAVREELKAIQTKQGKLEADLIKRMSDAKKEDRGALSEVGRELTDVDKYLERLEVLTKEALPEKLKRFKDYLNRSSDEGVTQLLATIKNETDRIEEKLEDLNSTLRRVDFQADRYLQLVCSKVTHESLRTLQKALKKLQSARLQDDNGESHYKALQDIVALLRDACERNRTIGAKSLLDPRFRLEFKVSVLNRETNHLIETRSGSQGGSGGEKEIIASYVLTASLSYALCPDGTSTPKFGTIVLDEAFSRSSHVVAGRIISALREFGLHALFITPNKEMKLLRNHTRSAIVVHRRGMESRLVAMSWKELEAAKQSVKVAANEAT
jgi:uncharacterized protein YPO0396